MLARERWKNTEKSETGGKMISLKQDQKTLRCHVVDMAEVRGDLSSSNAILIRLYIFFSKFLKSTLFSNISYILGLMIFGSQLHTHGAGNKSI